ncbi:MAG: glycine cleavage system protein GcvH [Spirochaetota bacterium]
MTYYTKDHEWIRVEGTNGVVGISEHAACELGDITFIELPKVGKQIAKGAVLASVESVKAASEVFAPVTLSVTKVNDALASAPETVNKSAEGDGWFVEVMIGNVAELSSLMDKAKYDEYVKGLKH